MICVEGFYSGITAWQQPQGKAAAYIGGASLAASLNLVATVVMRVYYP